MEDQKPTNESEAALLLKEAKNRRVAACADALKLLLAEHKCRLAAVPHIHEGRIVAVPQLIAETPTDD